MNTRNLFVHYVPIAPPFAVAGVPYTVTAAEPFVLIGQLAAGELGPLATPGGEHYNPLYLNNPTPDFRYLREGYVSPSIIASGTAGAQLAVLSAGEFPPAITFAALAPPPPPALAVDFTNALGWAPLRPASGPERVFEVFFNNGTSGIFSVAFARLLDGFALSQGTLRGSFNGNGVVAYNGPILEVMPTA